MGNKNFSNMHESQHYVRAWREERGWTATELARRAEMNDSFISQIEKGRSQCSLETLGKLAAAMEVSRGDLLDTDPKNPSTPIELLLPAGFWASLPEEHHEEIMVMMRVAKESVVEFVVKWTKARGLQRSHKRSKRTA